MVGREIWKRAGIWDYCASICLKFGGGGLDFHLTLYSSKNLQKISGPGFSLHSDIVAPYLLKYGRGSKAEVFTTNGQRRNDYCHRDD
jgi:acyl-CoA dehydrogenase